MNNESSPASHHLEPSRLYSFVRSRELEGTYPGTPDVGAWVVTAMRVGKGWGWPPEEAWPYSAAQHWPPAEPPGIDQLAKPQRVFAYSRVRSLEDCRMALSKRQTIAAAFEIDASWQASDGHIDDPRSHQPDGSHTICLVGYRDADEHLIFANSWGTGWGDEGYGYLPYRYWSDRLLEAWFQDGPRPEALPGQRSQGTVVRVGGVRDALGRMLHFVEIADLDHDEMLAWAIVVETADGLEVEEMFVRPAYRGAGNGRDLARTVSELSTSRKLPVKCWIPHADWTGAPTQAQGAIFRQLGVVPQPAPERWAAAIAIGPVHTPDPGSPA